ncbi:MAG: HupE/UreJ family protein [Myxococcota bacterium]|jgi:hydrogenase/urease accessory protein HupE|nr:HupE/UreJ family protein [Myxococcota bacterium]
MSRLVALVFALFVCSFAVQASAHSIDAATLTLTEVAEGKFAIDWQTTAKTLEGLREPAQYPKTCRRDGALLDCGPLGLSGTIEFPWLEGGESRVTVLIDWLSGSRLLRIVNGRAPSLTVYGIPASAGLRFLEPISVDYTRLGVEHILAGFDHLMFVLAVTILVRERRALLLAITAFTLAHSLTLAATVLGWLKLPSAAVETTIALSIVLACVECLRPADSLMHRKPWLVTFAFGLLHGMGFASALLETGLPERHVPWALLFFNVGVELGQLAAIAVFLTLGWSFTRIERRPAWSTRAFVYAMGSTAAYWSLERALAMFSA